MNESIRELCKMLEPTLNTFATGIGYKLTLQEGILTLYIKSLNLKSGVNLTQLKQKLGNIQSLIAGYSMERLDCSVFIVEVKYETGRSTISIISAE